MRSLNHCARMQTLCRIFLQTLATACKPGDASGPPSASGTISKSSEKARHSFHRVRHAPGYLPPAIYPKVLPACRTIVVGAYRGGWGDGGGTGAVSLAEAIASFLSMVELDFERNGIGEGGGRAQAETLRLNTTLTSLSLHYKSLGEGGGRAVAETLRIP